MSIQKDYEALRVGKAGERDHNQRFRGTALEMIDLKEDWGLMAVG